MQPRERHGRALRPGRFQRRCRSGLAHSNEAFLGQGRPPRARRWRGWPAGIAPRSAQRTDLARELGAPASHQEIYYYFGQATSGCLVSLIRQLLCGPQATGDDWLAHPRRRLLRAICVGFKWTTCARPVDNGSACSSSRRLRLLVFSTAPPTGLPASSRRTDRTGSGCPRGPARLRGDTAPRTPACR